MLKVIKSIIYGALVVFLSPLWIPIVLIMWFNTLTDKTNLEDDV